MNQPPIQVPGEGPKNARLMLVGEAPGKEEVIAKRPFVGDAGRILTSLLAAAGITREEVYITNVVKVRPPNNRYDRLRELGVSEESYLPVLRREIESVRPNCIVAVGSNAARVLTGAREVGKWRGSVVPCRLIEGYKVVVTAHPAAVLHPQDPNLDSIFADPGILMHVIAMDLARAKVQSLTPVNPKPDVNIILKPTLQQIEEYVHECLQAGHFSYDVETLPPYVIRCLGLSASPNSAIVIPFRNGLSNTYSPSDEEAVWYTIRRLFQAQGITKYAQNENFDLTYLVPFLGYPTSPRFDTLRAHQLIAPELPHDLDFLTSIYTYFGYYGLKGSVVRNADYDVWVYNAHDCMATLTAGLEMQQELQELGLYDFFSGYVMPLNTCLFEMQHRGVKIDLDRRREMAAPLQQELTELEQELHKEAGCELNFNSPKQLVDFFYTSGRHKAKLHYKRRTPTVDARALAQIAANGDRVAALVIECRRRTKMINTFLTAPVDDHGVIHTQYDIAVTGRLRSSEPTIGGGTNLQNVPKSARFVFVPRPGMCFVKGDLSQADARVVAWLTKGKMQQAFRDGKDIHQLTADLIGEERQQGKKMNHASNYDMGPGMLSMQLGVPQREAKRLLDLYHKAYPEVRQWHKRVQDYLRQNDRTLTNSFGRKHKFLGRWDNNLFKAAYADRPQSDVADCTNFGLIEFWLRAKALGAYPILQTHDEIVAECPLEHATECEHLLRECLEQPFQVEGEPLLIPLETKICFDSWLS